MQKNHLFAVLLALSGATAAWAEAPAAPSGDKPILKMHLPNGRVLYADRALKTPSQKVETLRGAVGTKVLASSGEASPKDKEAPKEKAAAAPTPAGAASQPTSLVEWAKKQEAAMEKQNKDFSEARDKINCEQARATMKSLNGPRPAKNTEKGEAELLTDNQISQEKAHAQKMILESCR